MAFLLFYLGLGALLTAEEAGVFLLPGDISLVAAGVSASANNTPHLLLVAWVVASGAMVAGASTLFHGVNQSSKSSRILPRRVRVLVRRHHVWGVAVARMVPGLRNATVFAAAASGLSYRTLLAGLIPAAVLWSGLLLLLGWFGGSAITETLGRLEGTALVRWGSLALFCAALAFAYYRIRSVRHRPDHLTPEALHLESTLLHGLHGPAGHSTPEETGRPYPMRQAK